MDLGYLDFERLLKWNFIYFKIIKPAKKWLKKIIQNSFFILISTNIVIYFFDCNFILICVFGEF